MVVEDKIYELRYEEGKKYLVMWRKEEIRGK